MRKIPELLSPVGGWKQLEAAVNHGADAVYMGGSLFNARINAENFTEESLADAIGFAHEKGVKVYITFNTLIRDSELERAFRYACHLYEIGADALIIQDMGLARLIRKYLPDFPMHLSTQGTVYNVQALDLVKQFGFSRVVPARELTLEEIGRLTEKAHSLNMDVEVFIHGALCMCYSGQCQMSRAFGGGGRSGNRGLCAQPCRLLYTDDKGRKGYFLSPKDLCTLDLIPQLIGAGVDSFKIEGRLKSAEYVAVTTSVYRKYLDLYAEKAAGSADITPEAWKAMIDPEDMQKLKRIFNRGGFTHGYLEGNPGEKILSGASPKNQGIYIGTVTSVRPVKGSREGREKTLLDVQLQNSGETIAQGDGVEIRQRAERSSADVTTGSTVVTYAEQLREGLQRIGDFDRGVSAGSRVYKVTDQALRREAMAAPEKKTPVRMRFHAELGHVPELELAGKAKSVTVSGDFAAEMALKKALDEEKIKNQLMKLGDTGFRADEEDVHVEIDLDIMIPVSVINRMRRQAAEKLTEALRCAAVETRRPLTEQEISAVVTSEALGSEDAINRVESAAEHSCHTVPLQEYGAAEEGLPYILNVSKGELDRYLEENFDAIADRLRTRGILIGNPGWIKQFTEAGVQVYGDYGLNVYNSQSVKAYEELGVKMLYLSHERSRSEETRGGRSSDRRFGGSIPLMITEHPFRTSYLIDRKGVKHEIVKDRDKNIVL